MTPVTVDRWTSPTEPAPLSERLAHDRAVKKAQRRTRAIRRDADDAADGVLDDEGNILGTHHQEQVRAAYRAKISRDRTRTGATAASDGRGRHRPEEEEEEQKPERDDKSPHRRHDGFVSCGPIWWEESGKVRFDPRNKPPEIEKTGAREGTKSEVSLAEARARGTSTQGEMR